MNELTETKLTNFFEQYKNRSFNKGDHIYRPDEEIEKVSFVKSGFVRVYSYDNEGKEVTFSGFKPIFWMSLFYSRNKRPNEYFFQALTEVELWEAPVAEFNKLLESDQKLACNIVDGSLNNMIVLLESWEYSVSGDAYKRIGKLLISLAKNYGVKKQDSMEIDFKTTHQLIASMLGLSRETVSIQIKIMENNGLINQNKQKMVINDFLKMKTTF